MLSVSHSPRKISFQSKKIPPKTVTIVQKNGRDIIKDEFVGFHIRKPNFIEFIRDIFENLFPLQK